MPHTPASAVTSRSGTGIAFRTASRTAITPTQKAGPQTATRLPISVSR